MYAINHLFFTSVIRRVIVLKDVYHFIILCLCNRVSILTITITIVTISLNPLIFLTSGKTINRTKIKRLDGFLLVTIF